MVSHFARSSVMLPPPRRKKQGGAKASMGIKMKSALLRTPLRVGSRHIMPQGPSRRRFSAPRLSQSSSDTSSAPSGVLPSSGGTAQYQPYASSTAPSNDTITSNALPSQASYGIDCNNTVMPMSQLTMAEFSNSSHSVQPSLSQNSMANHPQLHQQSATSSSSSMANHSQFHQQSVTSGTSAFYQPRTVESVLAASNSMCASASSAPRSLQVPHVGGGPSAMTPYERTKMWMAAAVSMATPSRARSARGSLSTLKSSTSDSGIGETDQTLSSRSTSEVRVKEEDTCIASDGVDAIQAKPTSLITHHFKPVSRNSAPDMNAQQHDAWVAHEQRLMKLASDIDSKISKFQSLESAAVGNFQSLYERKVRKFQTLEKASVARIKELSAEGVATLNQVCKTGSGALAKLADQHLGSLTNAAAKMKREVLKLIPTALLGKATASVSAAFSSHDHGRNRRQPASHQRACTSDDQTEGGDSHSRNTRVSLFPSLDKTTSPPLCSTTTRTSSKAATKHSRSEVAPTRRSKRHKKDPTTTQPSRATSPMPNAKSFCVTPSTKSASQVDPPVSISFSRGASNGTISDCTRNHSTKSTKRSASETTDGILEVYESRGRKKPRRAQKDLENGAVHLSSQESKSDTGSPVSLTQSETSSNFVSPLNNTARSNRKGRGRSRTYGNKKRRALATSIEDTFDFL